MRAAKQGEKIHRCMLFVLYCCTRYPVTSPKIHARRTCDANVRFNPFGVETNCGGANQVLRLRAAPARTKQKNAAPSRQTYVHILGQGSTYASLPRSQLTCHAPPRREAGRSLAPQSSETPPLAASFVAPPPGRGVCGTTAPGHQTPRSGIDWIARAVTKRANEGALL